MGYSIQWFDKVVYCRFTGAVTREDLLESNMSLYGQPAFDDLRLQVFDMLDAAEIRFTVQDVKEVAACDRAAAKINPLIRCAMVARDELVLSLSEIYQQESLPSPWECRSFTSLEEALEWAGAFLPGLRALPFFGRSAVF